MYAKIILIKNNVGDKRGETFCGHWAQVVQSKKEHVEGFNSQYKYLAFWKVLTTKTQYNHRLYLICGIMITRDL